MAELTAREKLTVLRGIAEREFDKYAPDDAVLYVRYLGALREKVRLSWEFRYRGEHYVGVYDCFNDVWVLLLESVAQSAEMLAKQCAISRKNALLKHFDPAYYNERNYGGATT